MKRKKTGKFERIIQLSRAFDKRHDDPKKNYGIHCVELQMILTRGQRAVQFKLYTNWHLSHVTKELDKRFLKKPDEIGLKVGYHPMPADLGYHSPVPMYEDQTMVSEKCEFTGGECYYDGSTLNAEPVFELLVREGSDAVWEKLEEYYHEIFDQEREELDDD